MPRIILNEAREVPIDRRPLTVEVAGRTDVVLAAEVAGEGAAVAVRRGARPGVVTLPDVAAPVRLRVTPRSGAAFAEGTVLTLVLRTHPGDDGEETTVTVRAVDVSGRPGRDLALLTPVDAHTVAVRRLVGLDVALEPLAAQARSAARSLLGVDRCDEPLDVVVTVDVSASMAPPTADGAVAAAVEVVVGVAQVLAPDGTPSVYLAGDRTTPVPAATPREIGARTSAAVGAAGRGAGFRAASSHPPVGPDTVVFVVTDGVPPDVDALAAAAGPDGLRRLVLVDPAGANQHTVGVPVAVVPAPPDGVRVEDHLLGSPAAMAELVRPLVDGFGRTGGRR